MKSSLSNNQIATLGFAIIGLIIILTWFIGLPSNIPEVALVSTSTSVVTSTSIVVLDQLTDILTPTAISTPTAIPTSTATPAPTATSTPTLTAEIVGYSAYTVTPYDTLQDVARRAGSAPDLLLTYNHLTSLPQAGQPLIIPHLADRPRTITSEPALIVQADTANPWVALTLDAGAGSDPVPDILATLRERDIQITFFLTGNWIRDNPDLARQIVADGHEVANHSLSHANFTLLSDAQIRDELAATEALMQETTGISTRPFFRPPFGAYDRRVLLTVANAGYLPIYWTLDSLDSVGEPKTPAFLLERVTGTLPPEELAGAIILAHCGSAATAHALPTILDRFAAMGFEVRTLSEVLDA